MCSSRGVLPSWEAFASIQILFLPTWSLRAPAPSRFTSAKLRPISSCSHPADQKASFFIDWLWLMSNMSHLPTVRQTCISASALAFKNGFIGLSSPSLLKKKKTYKMLWRTRANFFLVQTVASCSPSVMWSDYTVNASIFCVHQFTDTPITHHWQWLRRCMGVINMDKMDDFLNHRCFKTPLEKN